MTIRCVPSSIWCKAMAGAFVASWVAGCATDRLDPAPPSGVNLTGDWKLNLNLSDDPDKLGPDPDSTAPKHAPGGHRGHGGGRGGGGGGGGMPPIGSPPDGSTGNDEFGPTANSGVGGPGGNSGIGDPSASTDSYGRATAVNAYSTTAGLGDYRPSAYGTFQRVALTAPGIEQSTPIPPSTETSSETSSGTTGAKPSRGASINRLLRAPLTLSITQDKASITVKTNMPDGTPTVDVYTAGTKTTIPFGQEQTAERTAGWRGPVFVVTTSAKKFGTREDDFAIDTDDGRLIMTTSTKGGKLGKVDITRVYDRVRGAGP